MRRISPIPTFLPYPPCNRKDGKDENDHHRRGSTDWTRHGVRAGGHGIGREPARRNPGDRGGWAPFRRSSLWPTVWPPVWQPVWSSLWPPLWPSWRLPQRQTQFRVLRARVLRVLRARVRRAQARAQAQARARALVRTRPRCRPLCPRRRGAWRLPVHERAGRSLIAAAAATSRLRPRVFRWSGAPAIGSRCTGATGTRGKGKPPPLGELSMSFRILLEVGAQSNDWPCADASPITCRGPRSTTSID